MQMRMARKGGGKRRVLEKECQPGSKEGNKVRHKA
jgi:hypothetical protein